MHEDRAAATDKAKAVTCAAIRRVQHHEPFTKQSVPMNSATLIIGGGVAGMTAALELAGAAQPVFLVEKEDHLGGNVARIDSMSPYLDSAKDLLTERIANVTKNPKITVHAEVGGREHLRLIGNFKAQVKTNGGEPREIEMGSIIVCTGFKEFDATRAAVSDTASSQRRHLLRNGKC